MPTNAALTETAAKDFGRALRFIRQARGMSLRDVSHDAPISAQYLQNIERGERTAASLDIYKRLQRAYELPDGAIDGLLLRARIMSALEAHGVSRADSQTIWSSVETQLNLLRYKVSTDLAELVASLIY